ncbi:MAG: hypothetical protein HYT80_12095 [Euryarchaeota archaeon]|nr:hypothetical protein [Euryarchaeota archaeon]
MHVGARVAVSLALVPAFLAGGAALGYLGLLASDGNGWYVLAGIAIGAFALGAAAPQRWTPSIALAALAGAYWLFAYADGTDACDGRASCEDNLGPWTTFWVPTAFVVLPTLAGAVLWRRVRRGPEPQAPPEAPRPSPPS